MRSRDILLCFLRVYGCSFCFCGRLSAVRRTQDYEKRVYKEHVDVGWAALMRQIVNNCTRKFYHGEFAKAREMTMVIGEIKGRNAAPSNRITIERSMESALPKMRLEVQFITKTAASPLPSLPLPQFRVYEAHLGRRSALDKLRKEKLVQRKTKLRALVDTLQNCLRSKNLTKFKNQNTHIRLSPRRRDQ